MRKFALLAFLCAVFLCSPVLATDALDISTGLKTLLLVNNRSSGPVVVAVIYDPDVAVSRADADSIKADIDNGTGVPGGLRLTTKLMSIHDVAGLSGIKAAFLASGLSTHDYELVSNNAVPSGILTISTDTSCAGAGHCVLGIVTTPRVEIYYNAAVAEASHIEFSSAFLMLVKQI